MSGVVFIESRNVTHFGSPSLRTKSSKRLGAFISQVYRAYTTRKKRTLASSRTRPSNV